jgi:DNA-binding transcriptional MocR family regulator
MPDVDYPWRTQIGHLAVAAHLRDAILTGQYPPGARLPSEADLAFAMGCSRDTIRDAFAVLRRELLLVTERGFRALVPPVAQRRAVVLSAGTTVTARMPLHPELPGLDCRPEMPLLDVSIAGGGIERHPADRVLLVVPWRTQPDGPAQEV